MTPHERDPFEGPRTPEISIRFIVGSDDSDVADEPNTFRITLEAEDPQGLRDETPDSVLVTIACGAPDEVHDLRVRKTDDELLFGWDALSSPAQAYAIHGAGEPAGPLLEEVRTEAPVDDALSLPMPEGLRFYRVRGLNQPDCFGPL